MGWCGWLSLSASWCHTVAVEGHNIGEPSMKEVTTIGLDIAKHVFQAHGISASGEVIFRRKLRRSDVVAFFEELPGCLIGIEACATAHFWARQLISLGHQVKLIPAAYVKPYVKRQKHDAADAEAICEAVTRPTMRFVPVKTEEQQSVLMLHCVRELPIRQRTMLVNALRGHLAELGIVTQLGATGVEMLMALVEDEDHDMVTILARTALLPIVQQLRDIGQQIVEMDKQIMVWLRSNELSQRLEMIPDLLPISWPPETGISGA
jgi:transposase